MDNAHLLTSGTPVVQDPHKTVTLCPTTTRQYKTKISTRKQKALNVMLNNAKGRKYLKKAFRDSMKSTRLINLAVNEGNPIRQRYLFNLARLKKMRAEEWVAKHRRDLHDSGTKG